MSETSAKQGPAQLQNKGNLMTRREWGITALGTVATLVFGGSGSIGGYEKGLQDGIVEGTKRAQADGITATLIVQNNLRLLEATLEKVLTPGYEPAGQRGEVLSLPTNVFSSEPLNSIYEFIGNVPTYLDYLVTEIDKDSNNKGKNPHFSHLPTMQILGELDPKTWKPPTLRTILHLIRGDLGINIILGEEKFGNGAVAGTYTEVKLLNGPNAAPSKINFNPQILNELYPTADNPDRKVRLSKFGLLPILVYEYMNRLNSIALLVLLDKMGFLKDATQLSTESIQKWTKEIAGLMKPVGHPLSVDNNYVQLAMISSLSVIAGSQDGTNPIIGLERHEAWRPLHLWRAANHGDMQAVHELYAELNLRANY